MVISSIMILTNLGMKYLLVVDSHYLVYTYSLHY